MDFQTEYITEFKEEKSVDMITKLYCPANFKIYKDITIEFKNSFQRISIYLLIFTMVFIMRTVYH